MLTKFSKWPTLRSMAKKNVKKSPAKAKKANSKSGKANAKKKAPAKPLKVIAKAKTKAKGKIAKPAAKIAKPTVKAPPPKVLEKAKPAAKIASVVKSAPALKAKLEVDPKVDSKKLMTKAKIKSLAKEIAVDEEPAALAPPEPTPEVVLTDAEGRRYCRVKDCDQLANVDAYCRYHYLLYWKRIQVRKKILTEGKLERYIEELTARYPDKFLDMLRKDLSNEKEFLLAIQELEIDESANEGEFEDENENFIDEVRGMSEPVAREEEEGF
jgi:hypothetical protein